MNVIRGIKWWVSVPLKTVEQFLIIEECVVARESKYLAKEDDEK